MSSGRDGGDRPDTHGTMVPLSAVYEVFEARDDPARPLTANDVLDAVGCSRRTAHNKLTELVERGLLATRKVGSRGRVWWVPMDGADHEAPAGVDCDESAVPRAAVQDADLPGTGETLDARRAALVAAWAYLKAHGEAKKSDFLSAVYPDHPAGLDTAEGWWNATRPALAGLPGVDAPDNRGHIWSFLDES